MVGSELEGLSIKGFGQALSLLGQLPRIRREVLRLWDEAQTRLHALPAKAFVDLVASAGVPPGLTFDSAFAGQRASVEQFGLSGLRPAVDWLMANTPRQSTAVVCHSSFHSSNVLADDGRLTGVIDLVKATIAEPAFDYGGVMAILATVRPRTKAGIHRMLRGLMNNLARTRSRQCGTTPETEAALRYCQVFNCLVGLVTVGKSRAQGNLTRGAYNSPVGVANLVNHACTSTDRTHR